MAKRTKRENIIISLTIFSIFMAVYLSTIAPSISWANQGVDGGDLITATATSGVAHPSGYPTYLLIASIFQLVPLGTLAFRTNLLSAICMSLTAPMVFLITLQWIEGSIKIKRVSGVIASLSFGLAPMVWGQAVITEVYALHIFFIGLLLLLYPFNKIKNQAFIDRAGGLVFGVSMGNHLTTILLLPVWILQLGLPKHSGNGIKRNLRLLLLDKGNWLVVTRRGIWLITGLLIYGTLFLRAHSGSPVNWGNPRNWENFWWLVSGQLYQDRLFDFPLSFLIQRFQAWANLLIIQFGIWGIIISLFGLFFGRLNSLRFYMITIWVVIIYSLFSIGYDSSDSQVYLLPVILVFALWLGWGLSEVFNQISTWNAKLFFPSGLLILTLIVFQAWQTLPRVDAKKDDRAEVFGMEVMQNAPENAILFSDTDQESFTIWYYNYALKQRDDLIVLVEGLLPYKWYRDTLRETYPDLNLPELTTSNWQLVIAENNYRPVCVLDIDVIDLINCK